MQSIGIRDVLDMKPLNGFESVFILSDATKSYAQTVVEPGICNADVRTVRFHGDTVVSIVDSPVIEFDMRREDSVGAVSIGYSS